MKLMVMVLVLLTCACSAHRTRVDCEGRLKPINPPARMSSNDATPAIGARR
jgi:hypothetical protein